MNAPFSTPETDEPGRGASQAGAGMSRRGFVKLGGVAAATLSARAMGSEHGSGALDEDRMGVLVDLTQCVGCRRCEWACCEANGLPHGELHEYDDQSVFESRRHPNASELTVVNRGRGSGDREPVHLKVQCMHCEKPACVSACLVGALQKDPKGPVFYDASRCIGCRYCLVACPFGCLGYEYDRVLTARVRKCELCRDRTAAGKLPACVEMCPVEALTYGRRSELLAIAHERIAAHPDRYVDHVYGEREAGGTSWLYLAGTGFADLGFPRVADRSLAEVTEAIQHGIFKYFAAPLALGGLLAATYTITKRKDGHP